MANDRFLDAALDQTAALLDVHEAVDDLDIRWRTLARRDDVPATWDDQVHADLCVLRHYIKFTTVWDARLQRPAGTPAAR